MSEPMYFYLSFASRQDKVSNDRKEPMEHKVPLKDLTKAKVHVNQDIPLSDSKDKNK